LTGRLVDQRSALRRVTIEIGEFLAILALKDQWLAADWRPRLKAREAIIDIGQPVATLGVLAFIDHIGADIALSCPISATDRRNVASSSLSGGSVPSARGKLPT
jgi:hypothetical protein